MKTILSAGHSGVAWGHYLTRGKRSPKGHPGILEGEFDRAVVELVCGLSYSHFVLNLNPGPINIPLKHFRDKKHFSSQTAAINEIVRRENLEGNSVISLNIHANAAGAGWNDKREGAVMFVRNKPSQDEIRLARCLKKRFDAIEHYVEPTRELRKNFTMVHKVKCPAVLVECGFMTDREDAEYMKSESGRWEIARAIYYAIGDFRHKNKTEEWAAIRRTVTGMKVRP